MPRTLDLPHDYKARIRAALGYTELKLPEVADALGVSQPTLARMYTDKDGHKPPSLSDLEKLAKITGLPKAFFTADFTHMGKLPAAATIQVAATAHARTRTQAAAARKRLARTPPETS